MEKCGSGWEVRCKVFEERELGSWWMEKVGGVLGYWCTDMRRRINVM